MLCSMSLLLSGLHFFKIKMLCVTNIMVIELIGMQFGLKSFAWF